MPRVLLGRRNDRFCKLGVLLHGTIHAEKKCPEELGKVLGVSRSTMYRYLGRLEALPLDKLLLLARHLHIPIDELRECIRY